MITILDRLRVTAAHLAFLHKRFFSSLMPVAVNVLKHRLMPVTNYRISHNNNIQTSSKLPFL